MTIEWQDTIRGFRLGRFRDRYNSVCSIQESSLATENAIWLGVEIAFDGHECPTSRMHLTQEQVRALLPVLEHFAETGALP